MQRSTKVTISLPEDLARFVDKLAERLQRPRSQVFADLVDEKRKAILRESMVVGYQRLAAENKQFAGEAMAVSDEIWDELEEEDWPALRERT